LQHQIAPNGSVRIDGEGQPIAQHNIGM